MKFSQSLRVGGSFHLLPASGLKKLPGFRDVFSRERRRTLGDEVRLAVHFDHYPELGSRVDVRLDDALRRLARGLENASSVKTSPTFAKLLEGSFSAVSKPIQPRTDRPKFDATGF